MNYEGTHIRIHQIRSEKIRKTKVWDVDSKSGAYLGRIGWLGRWRRYVFAPSPNSLFEETCLKDIAGFIEDRSVEYRKTWRKKP